MTLSYLHVENFRCLEEVELELDPHCTLMVGPNASGKTSLLEAVHVLSCGRSFRTRQTELLVRSGSSSFTIAGRVRRAEREVALGVKGSRNGFESRAGGQNVRGFAELAALLPVQVIDPNVHCLIEEGPEMRRAFLDRGLFHVEPTFITTWRRYQRSLKQRNQSLRAGSPVAEVRAWDGEMIESANLIQKERERYIEGLQVFLEPLANAFFGAPIELLYHSGWSAPDLAAALDRAWSRDLQLRTSTAGPHRADLSVRVSGNPAKQFVSRGQQKLLAAALVLAQLAHLANRQSQPGCLLLDDPAAELDVDNLSKLLEQVGNLRAQLIVTSLNSAAILSRFGARVFHVKQGRATAVL